jgi:hypothetical protein
VVGGGRSNPEAVARHFPRSLHPNEWVAWAGRLPIQDFHHFARSRGGIGKSMNAAKFS